MIFWRPLVALIIVVFAGYFFRGQIPNIVPNVGSSIKQFASDFKVSNLKNSSSQVANQVAEELKEHLPPPLKVSTAPIPDSVDLNASSIVSLTNQARSLNGVVVNLKENAALTVAAQTKVRDMFNRQYFDHISPVGKGPADLAKEQGYVYILIGENLALGNFKDNQALVDAWMASPGHRANILNKKFTEMGAAVEKGMYQGKMTWLAVQEFGEPISACPSIDVSLKTRIESEKDDLDKKADALEVKKKNIDNTYPKQGDEYNNKIREYNSMIAEYNAQVKAVKADVETYNAQVKAFNSCASA